MRLVELDRNISVEQSLRRTGHGLSRPVFSLAHRKREVGGRLPGSLLAFLFEYARNTNFRLGFRCHADRRSDSRGVAVHRVAVALALQPGASVDATRETIWLNLRSGTCFGHAELRRVRATFQRHR